jgi:ABC-type transport system involved in multi-copper enzyme maturation permease subunit
MNHAFRIAWIAIRELLYERVFYILVLFAGMALILSLLLGQMTYAEQSKLTLDFMLGGIQLSMVLFSVFMGISLLQRELQMGSIAMVLSKPISRASFLMGKYMGQVAIQFVVMAAMTLVVFATCPDWKQISALAVAQCVALIYLEVLVITAVTYLFAVNAGSITAALATLCLFALGHFQAAATPSRNLSENAGWEITKTFVPNLEVFNMKSVASYGFSIPWNDFGITAAYALVVLTMFLSIAIVTFNRKDIFT